MKKRNARPSVIGPDLMWTEAEAAGLQPQRLAVLPPAAAAHVEAFLGALSPGCDHVRLGAFALAVMPCPWSACPECAHTLDIEMMRGHCSRCFNPVFAETAGAIAGCFVVTRGLWVLATFCPSCANGDDR